MGSPHLWHQRAPDIAIPAIAWLPGWARNRQAAALGELAAPIGLIMAQRNPLLPRAFEAARGTRPFAGVQTIPNVGHFLMLEAPTRSTIGCATCSGSLQPKLAEA
jgi:pimeloyl-ACP methyl ester carboxylesterase